IVRMNYQQHIEGRTHLLGLSIFLLFFSVFSSQTLFSSGSEVNPEKDYKSFVLENGLEVVVVENHLAPIVTIELATRNGSFTEGPEYAGLSHLYEHMFFKGNKNFPRSQDFLSYLSKIGAIWNATTREEVVNYYFTLPSMNLQLGMELMANTIQTPLFNKTELEREREVVLGEFDRHEASPLFLFRRVMDSVTWGDNFTRKEPIGQRDVIATATVEKMRAIQQKYYIPNNSLLIVAGDVDSATVYKMAQRYFTSWERGADPFETDPPPFPKPLTEKKLVQVPSPINLVQATYQWYGPSVSLDPKSTYAADVFIYILTQDQSRFQRRLVESGLSQSAGFSYYTQNYTGPIAVSIGTTEEKAKQAMKVLWDEIQAFDSPDYFTDEELETAKAYLRVEHLYDAEETSEWTHTIGFWWSTTGGLDYFRGYLDNLSQITREDIQNFIRRYVKGKNYILGVTGSEAALQELNLVPSEVLR
ncbi:MAG: M16 family metallopeptidase, partial [Candidatus Kapaibacterium sp.]